MSDKAKPELAWRIRYPDATGWWVADGGGPWENYLPTRDKALAQFKATLPPGFKSWDELYAEGYRCVRVEITEVVADDS